MNILEELYKNELIDPPDFCLSGLHLLCIGGSIAYKCNTDWSDQDLLGVVVPPSDYLFPTGIYGYDQYPKFDDYQKHHIEYDGIEYDIKLYSIVRLFRLAEDGNPNILDFLASSNDTVLYSTPIGDLLRNNISLFLSKQCIAKYLGFSYSHFQSMKNHIKSGKYPNKRKHLFNLYGYDTKDASHILRCLLALKDILINHVYSPDAHGEYIKGIRDGKFSYEKIKELRNALICEIKDLEQISTLQEKPNKVAIRSLLVKCLEVAYE